MLNIQQKGSMQNILADIKNVRQEIVPYAISMACTQIAQQAAKKTIPNEMKRVFAQPRAYTLNSLFIVPATKNKLSARVAVKNEGGNQVAQERFLFTQIKGGRRNDKRFEKSLQFSSFLPLGWRAAIGSQSGLLDGQGQIKGLAIQRLLMQMKTKTQSALFVGKAGKKGAQGIWMRDSKTRKLTAMVIFTRTQTIYRPRLDFSAVVEKTANDFFPNEFRKALNHTYREQGAKQ